MKIYLVGGAVRDALLRQPVKDRDWLIVGGSIEIMLEKGYQPVGKDFPVFLHPETKEEYALARTERKTAIGYHGFQFNADKKVTLKADLLRRDLTINALAQDDTGEIKDYFGGLKDLKQKILCHISPAFAEDPVRILRTARFAARYSHLGFTIAPETIKLMKQMVRQGEVNALVAERVWQETVNALKEKNPEVFFMVLKKCGALKILYPEIDQLFYIPEIKKYHPEGNTGKHTLLALQQATKLSSNTATRFATLTHDLGKVKTETAILPHHYKHEIRGVALIKQLCSRYKISNKFRKLAINVAKYHTHIHRADDQKPITLLKVLQNCDAFRQPETFKELLIACKADNRGRLGKEHNAYPQMAFYLALRKRCQAVDVQDIIKQGYKGKAIAEQLRLQRLKVIKNYKLNRE